MDQLCEDCGVLLKLTSPSEATCPECGRICDYFGEDQQAQMGEPQFQDMKVSPRLRGTGGQRQSFLDKSSSINTESAVYNDLVAELRSLNKEYRQNHEDVFPESTLKQVAQIFTTEVRPERVIRADNKTACLATLTHLLTIDQGKSLKAVTNLFQISGGLAKGEKLLNELGVCRNLLCGSNVRGYVESAFRSLGFAFNPQAPVHSCLTAPPRPAWAPDVEAGDAALLDKLKKAAVALVEASQAKKLGISKVEKTQAMGATFVVLRRAALAGLLPPRWRVTPVNYPLDSFAERCKIRKQTLEGYLQTLHEYHRQFRGLYRELGLAPQKLPAAF